MAGVTVPNPAVTHENVSNDLGLSHLAQILSCLLHLQIYG